MRKSICASVLLCTLCVTTLAGDILNPPAPGKFSTPPNETLPYVEQSTDDRNGDEISDPSADSLTVAALSLLDTVLALL